MNKVLLLIILIFFTSLGYSQNDTSKITIDSSQLSSIKLSSDLVKTISDSIAALNKTKEKILKDNEGINKQNEVLLKQGQSLEINNKKIKDNNAELLRINNLFINQKDLLTKQIDELQKQTNALQDTLIDKTQKIKTKDSLIDEKIKKSKALDTTIQKANKTLEERKASISKQLDSLEVIANIEMKDSVRIYKWRKPLPSDNLTSIERRYKLNVLANDFQTSKIQEIHITVKEGIILEIIVKTDTGIFRNTVGIIDLLHLGKSKKVSLLFYEHQDFDKHLDSTCIFLDDIIKYTPIRSYNDVAYGDFDITLTPTDNGRSYLLRESTSINTYFNVAAFTDIKGISGEPNGIAQFTADAKFITNTRTIGRTAIALGNYIAFHGGLSKFDSDFKGTELLNNDSISRKDLFQRANYALGVKLNIFKWFLSPQPLILYDKIEINAGYNFLGTKVFDTLFKDVAHTIIDTSYRNITQNQLYIEPIITFSRHRNFSMNIAIPFYFNSIKQNAKINPGIKNINIETWAAPGISLMYFGKRDTGSKLFFRYNHYINIRDKTQSFSQMQLGYSLNITEAWGSSESK
ncbi:MAG: hypothetical protein ABI594_13480 [Ginsengibacter sp.]